MLGPWFMGTSLRSTDLSVSIAQCPYTWGILIGQDKRTIDQRITSLINVSMAYPISWQQHSADWASTRDLMNYASQRGMMKDKDSSFPRARTNRRIAGR